MKSKGIHNSELTPNARELRKNMTKQENQLWYHFLRFYPVKIIRQKVIGLYIADFYCAKASLVIEIDGSQHYTNDGKEYDAIREEYMKNFGIMTIRYTNNEVDRKFDAVCNDIDAHIKKRLPPVAAATSPLAREGGKEHSKTSSASGGGVNEVDGGSGIKEALIDG